MSMSLVDEALSILLSFVFLILYFCGAEVAVFLEFTSPFVSLRGLLSQIKFPCHTNQLSLS